MKKFFRGLFHLLLQVAMWIPCHPFRRLICIVVMREFHWSSAICRNVELRCPYRISVGENSIINKNCLIDGRYGGIVIGSHVDIAQEVNIWTEQHDYNSPNYDSTGGGVIIEDYVWIASRATILPGVTIGQGAVIASCAVVTKDVPPMTVVAGVPARIIGTRDKDALQYNLNCRAWFK